MPIRRLTCIAALVATTIASGHGIDPSRASQAQAADSLYIVLYGTRITDHGAFGVGEKTDALERIAGFKSSFRYRGPIRGFAARLSSQALEKVRSDADVIAVHQSPSEFVVTYPHTAIAGEVRAKIRSDTVRLRFDARFQFLRSALYGFAARLSARQIGSLARDPSTFRIRPDPSPYVVLGPSPDRAMALSRELGFTLRSVGANGFSAELSAVQLTQLLVQHDIRLIDGVFIDPIESFPLRFHLVFFPTRPASYAPALRAAFLRAHPQFRRADVRGPLGRIRAATYRKREYALATMSVRRLGTRGQPELFVRPAGGRWRDVGATAGKICTAVIPVRHRPDLVPLMVIRAWELKLPSKNGVQISTSCYHP
jgi:hypothetical protein